jgi:hypothetical protein
MDNVDMVLSYLRIDLVGTININVQKQFLKSWYKKNKITLQGISLSKPTKLKGVHDAMFTGTSEVISIDTSNDESMVTNKIDDIIAHEDMTQHVHHNTKEAPPDP